MRIYIAIIIFFWGLISFGHEGHKHAEPTQLSSLYGGTLVEASHNHHKSGKHDHVEASSREFFFEVVYNKKAYKLYWLQLAKDSKTKLEIPTSQSSFKITKVHQINPRKKSQIKKLSIEKSKDHWLLTPVKIRGKRALLKIEGQFNGETFIGTAQVERR